MASPTITVECDRHNAEHFRSQKPGQKQIASEANYGTQREPARLHTPAFNTRALREIFSETIIAWLG